MKTLNRLIAFAFLLCPTVIYAQAASTDNEILLDQSGDTLTLTVDQVGYGNKLCGTIASGVCSGDWIFTGTTNTFDIDMIGNLNKIFGPTILDSSDVDLKLTGDSNSWDWNVGYGGSSDSAVMDVEILGDSNTFDIDWGYNASSERLDFDLLIDGDSNNWDINIDADDVTWNFDVLGSSNDFALTQKDGSDQSMTVEWVGSNGDVDIMQQSGTCPQGVSSCFGVINAEFDSENATVNIVQKDAGDS